VIGLFCWVEEDKLKSEKGYLGGMRRHYVGGCGCGCSNVQVKIRGKTVMCNDVFYVIGFYKNMFSIEEITRHNPFLDVIFFSREMLCN